MNRIISEELFDRIIAELSAVQSGLLHEQEFVTAPVASGVEANLMKGF